MPSAASSIVVEQLGTAGADAALASSVVVEQLGTAGADDGRVGSLLMEQIGTAAAIDGRLSSFFVEVFLIPGYPGVYGVFPQEQLRAMPNIQAGLLGLRRGQL